jgi:hypothetical protein
VVTREKIVACLDEASFALIHLKIENCDTMSSNTQACGRGISDGYRLLFNRFRHTLKSFKLSSDVFDWRQFPKCRDLKVLSLRNNQLDAIHLDYLLKFIRQLPRLEAPEIAIDKLNGTFDMLTTIFKSGVKRLSIQNYVDSVQVEKMIESVEQQFKVETAGQLPIVTITNFENKI